MRVKKIRLKNGYKRFRDLTIDLGENPARIVALVGPNGCGKSSVLDGMVYLAGSYANIGKGSQLDWKYHSMDQVPGFGYQNIEIEFTKGALPTIVQQLRSTGRDRTIFSFRSPYRYNTHLNVTQTKATNEIRLNDYGANSSSRLDEKMEENYRRLYALYNRYMQDQDVRPSEARAKIIGDLNDSLRKCVDLELCSIGNVEGAKGSLFFRKSGQQVEIDFNVLSSGEKEVVDILLDLYLRQEHFNDTVFLFDEPELHINTSVQRKLLVEMNRLVGEDCQIWIATHSIGFLRALQTEFRGDCQIIEFREEDQLASQERTLRPSNITPKTWRKLFAIALDDLASLVSPRILVYCEGRADVGKQGGERGMDAQAFNNIFGSNRPDVLFVSSGGNTELDQRSGIAMAILGKVFPTLEILVLKDRDMASGKDTCENDRQVYLKNNPNSHRVLRRWEIENYLFDKQVLRAYCQDNRLTFDESEYDKRVNDIVNQNLKDDTSRIRNFCGIKGSVSADAFKITLSTYLTEDLPVFKELSECIFNRA